LNEKIPLWVWLLAGGVAVYALYEWQKSQGAAAQAARDQALRAGQIDPVTGTPVAGSFAANPGTVGPPSRLTIQPVTGISVPYPAMSPLDPDMLVTDPNFWWPLQ
jgi:hypothetical protein